ncbi:MAG: hypothetical protein QXT28_08325 [Thermofilaceae archaeon]
MEEFKFGKVTVKLEKTGYVWAEPIIASLYIIDKDVRKVKRFYGAESVIIYCEETASDKASYVFTVPSTSWLEYEVAKRIFEEVAYELKWKEEECEIDIEINDSDVYYFLRKMLEELK